MSDKGRKPIAVVTKSGGVVSYKELQHYALKSESRQVEDAFANHYSPQGIVEPLYNPAQLMRLLDYNTYHARCCRTKARDVAGPDWQLSPKPDVENPGGQRKEELDTFFSELSFPLNEILYRVMLDFYAVGWGAIELVREEYDPEKPHIDMFHHPAHTLRAHRDHNRWCQIVGNKRVWFKAVGEGRHIDYHTGDFYDELDESKRGSELLVYPAYSPRTAYYGIPEAITSIGAIHGDISRAQFNAAFFKNFGVPAFAVMVSGDYDAGEEDEEGLTALEREVKEHFQEITENPWSTLFLSIPSETGEKVNVQLVPLSVDVKEASFRLFRKDNRDEILHAHGVPGYRIGVAETGQLGGNLAEEATQIYFQSVVGPHQNLLEHLINTHIVWKGFEAHDWRLKIMGVERADEMHELTVLEKLVDIGAARPIEVARHFAEKYGLDPDEDNPALHGYYLKGRPLGAEATTDEVVAAAKGRLLELEKELRGDGARSSTEA